MKLFMFLWQLPQNLLGYAKSRFWKKRLDLLSEGELAFLKETELAKGKKIYVVCRKSWQNDPVLGKISASSLGKYICLHGGHGLKTVKHELGHCVQSERLGWLYLPLVGIPSAFWNLLSRHSPRVRKTYFERWPEKQADLLGGVVR